MALFKQWDERMQRQVLIGTGRVIADSEGVAKKMTKVKDTDKITFSVMTAYSKETKNKDEPNYEIVPLAVYNFRNIDAMFEIAQTINKGDYVFFVGWLYQSVYLDRNGKQRKFIEVRVEWLQRAADLVIGMTKGKQITTTTKNQDDWF